MTAVAHPSDAAPDDETPSIGAGGEPENGSGDGAAQRSTTREGAALIARFVRMHPVPFAVSLIGGVSWAVLVVGVTFVLGRITDDVIEPGFEGGVAASTLWWAVVALILVAVLRGLSVVVRRWYGSVTETRMQASLRAEVGERLLTMPMRSYRRRPTGQLLANADVDITTGTQLLMPLPFSIGVIALVVVSLVSLITADPWFALVAVLLFPALALLSRRYTNAVSGPAAVVQARLGEVSAIAHESFDGALAVKTLGLAGSEDDRFRAAAGRLRSERLHVASLTAVFQPLIDLLPNLGTVALLVAGAWRIDSGAATPGQLVQAVALFSWLAFPMRIIGFMFEALPRSVVSVRRVDALLDEPVDLAAQGRGSLDPDALDPASATIVPGAPPPARRTAEVLAGASARAASIGTAQLPPGALSLELDDVSFSYGDTVVLDGVSFAAEPGEVLALVGSTGSGKSTLCNLLVRLDEPDAGEVRVGGVDVRSVDPDELRTAVSLAFQEAFLFAATVERNVTMGRPLDAEQLDEVLDRARAARFVAALPRGAETIVGERGVTLSGGQRQRVALARALAGAPRVLVLDDATSAVDPVIEAEILGGLRSGETTMLVVAHRLSTILLADRVVHLEDGRIRGIGRHDELLEDPEYAALVTAYEAEEAVDHDAWFADDPDWIDPDASVAGALDPNRPNSSAGDARERDRPDDDRANS